MKLINDKTFAVAGSKGKKYYVNVVKNVWSCECMDFAIRKRECKHIIDSKIHYANELFTKKYS